MHRNGGAAANAALTTAPQRRNQKTLGWYIGEPAKEAVGDSFTLAQYIAHDRKDSLDSVSSHHSATRHHGSLSSSVVDLEERRRRSIHDGGKQTRHGSFGQQAKKIASLKRNKENEGAKEPSKEDLAKQLGKSSKEDYWYYDPVSDGFYYEHGGSRGWRKRNPKLHGSPMAMTHNETIGVRNAEPMTTQQAPPHPQQVPPVSKFFPPVGIPVAHSASNVPNIKYYDAASDGYFYEMASIDGWRRRQPMGMVGGNSPPGSLPNYSMATRQAHGHMQPPQQRIFRPLQPHAFAQYQAHQAHYHQPPPPPPPQQQQQQQQKPIGTPPTAFRQMPQPAQQYHMDGQLPFSATINGPICTCGQLPANVQQRQALLASLASNEQRECPSSPSTAMSSSLSDGATPPPATHWQQQTRNVDSGVNIAQVLSQKNATPVGSFEEPYEFYWSDNEKQHPVNNSNIGERAASPAEELGRERQDSLSDYFKRLCDAPENQQQRQRQINEAAMKRPDSLKIANSTLAVPSLQQRQHQQAGNLPNFNVDKFIADLPDLQADTDSMLSNLSALRTPLETNQRGTFDPMMYSRLSCTDSPLYTPVPPKESVWERMSFGGGGTSAAATGKPGEITASESANSVSSLEFNLANIAIEKIWGCPAF